MASFTSQSGALTLKVELHGDVRRCRPWPAPGISPCFAELMSSVRSLFPEVEEALVLRYKDEDGDLCSVVEASFSDAWETAQSGGVFRLSAMPATPSELASMADAESVDANWTVVQTQEPTQQEEDEELPSEPSSPAQQKQDEQQRTQEEEPRAQPQQEEAWEEISSEQEAVAPVAVGEAALPVVAAVPVVESEILPTPSAAAPASGWSFTSPDGEPRLRRPAQSFAQQLVGDFKETRQDMKSAFLGANDENEAPALRKVGNVVGFVAGLGVAARMAPVRATRLAAESFHAVTSPGAEPTSGASFQAPAAAPETEAPAQEEPAPSEPQSVGAPSEAGAPEAASDVARGLDCEVEHFAEQVKNDFKTVRHEVRDVLGYVCGSRTSIGRDSSEEPIAATTPPEQQGTFREVVPNLASNAVGFLVAAHLVPFRAIRLGVAGTGRGVSALRASSGAAAASSSTSQ